MRLPLDIRTQGLGYQACREHDAVFDNQGSNVSDYIAAKDISNFAIDGEDEAVFRLSDFFPLRVQGQIAVYGGAEIVRVFQSGIGVPAFKGVALFFRSGGFSYDIAFLHILTDYVAAAVSIKVYAVNRRRDSAAGRSFCGFYA